jgi:hypothetical protein
VACSGAGVEVVVCPRPGVEAAVCSGVKVEDDSVLEDGRQWQQYPGRSNDG